MARAPATSAAVIVQRAITTPVDAFDGRRIPVMSDAELDALVGA